jgi:hypothetical protein
MPNDDCAVMARPHLLPLDVAYLGTEKQTISKE